MKKREFKSPSSAKPLSEGNNYVGKYAFKKHIYNLKFTKTHLAFMFTRLSKLTSLSPGKGVCPVKMMHVGKNRGATLSAYSIRFESVIKIRINQDAIFCYISLFDNVSSKSIFSPFFVCFFPVCLFSSHQHRPNPEPPRAIVYRWVQGVKSPPQFCELNQLNASSTCAEAREENTIARTEQ